MSKKVSQLLVLALATSAAFVGATSHGTYLTIIPGDAEQRSLVAANCCSDDADAKTSQFAVTAGYSRTWDSAKLGAYFAPDADDNNVVSLDSTSPAATAVDSSRIIRLNASTALYAGAPGDATVTLNPVSTRFFLGLNYNQDLKNVMEGAWFNLGVTLARVKNDLRAVVTAAAKASNENISVDGLLQGDTPGTTGFTSAALAYSKIKNAYAPDAQTRPEEIKMRLGYNFVNNDSGTFGGFVSGLIGLGTEPTMEWLFEAVAGHRNFGIGAGLMGTVSLSEGDDYKMFLNINGSAHYMFAREDYRLGKFTGMTGNSNWMRYYLATDGTTKFPMANALRQKVNVAPRYVVDLGAQFVYAGDCTQFDLGYIMNYRAKEENTLVTAWNDATYNLYDAGAVATATTAVKAANLTWNEESQLLHTIHGGVLYTMKDMENPVSVGLGGSISLANDRTRSEQHWTIFGKLGVSF